MIGEFVGRLPDVANSKTRKLPCLYIEDYDVSVRKSHEKSTKYSTDSIRLDRLRPTEFRIQKVVCHWEAGKLF